MGRTLFPGSGAGSVLALTAPLSFWGGVNPENGRVIDPRHPQSGQSIAGQVTTIPRLIGSSSSSSVMLELIRGGCAPAALLLGAADAILVVGCLAGRELGYTCPPVVEVDPMTLLALRGGDARVEAAVDRAMIISADGA
ncbi:MAG: DUF126 domain-containing protein [Rhodobacteraceae bacterium]|nr:DUF126 domain-containing protein [Paracoccaceae bacterium]